MRQEFEIGSSTSSLAIQNVTNEKLLAIIPVTVSLTLTPLLCFTKFLGNTQDTEGYVE